MWSQFVLMVVLVVGAVVGLSCAFWHFGRHAGVAAASRGGLPSATGELTDVLTNTSSGTATSDQEEDHQQRLEQQQLEQQQSELPEQGLGQDSHPVKQQCVQDLSNPSSQLYPQEHQRQLPQLPEKVEQLEQQQQQQEGKVQSGAACNPHLCIKNQEAIIVLEHSSNGGGVPKLNPTEQSSQLSSVSVQNLIDPVDARGHSFEASEEPVDKLQMLGDQREVTSSNKIANTETIIVVAGDPSSRINNCVSNNWEKFDEGDVGSCDAMGYTAV